MLKKALSSISRLNLRPLGPKPVAGAYALSLCCIIKDENDYLEEWINFHLKTGIGHFYIYDNDSRLPVYSTLKELGLLQHVTVIRIPGRAMQIKAYTHCLKKFGHTSKWIGFIDTDEFIVAKSTNGNMIEFLKDYSQYGGLGISSLFFGSNGHQKKTGRPQLESFNMRSDESFGPNSHVKCIVQPEYTESASGAHSFTYKNGKYCVNENFMPVTGPYSPNSVSKIQLNHYYCRSREEYEAKIARGYGDTSKKRQSIEFDNHDRESNVTEDITILELFS